MWWNLLRFGKIGLQMKYFIQTFGCQQNVSDSERIAAMPEARGMEKAKNIDAANHIIINTCMVKEMAENRVYGLVNNLTKKKRTTGMPEKIVVTGCMVGMAARDKTGKFLKLLKIRMPEVDEFLPIEEVGFDHAPLRTNALNAWVPISNGCNNFCTFCVVPFTRGREISRPYNEVIKECQELANHGYKKITLLGMNVNSYGADLILGSENIHVMRDIKNTYFDNSKIKNLKLNENLKFKIENSQIKPIYVKHLNRYRIPTLFPYLLKDICKIEGIGEIDFMSSNPWDFSEVLIDVIAHNPKVTRSIHLPVQSGSNSVLKRMNRWYTREQYLDLVKNLKFKIENLKLSTDIIVGFCGESEEEFLDTVDLAKKVGFYKAYISMYSDRPATAAHKAFKDDIPHSEKKSRWQILENLINKPNLAKGNLN
ncbi:radical SAM protein [Candidatus Gottesmanbacteria bacterium]|nr:radical SAM protein [Candidatus Gottesmanbacteria bacterium]